MRFDKLIGLYVLEDIADGLGGHIIQLAYQNALQ